MLQHVIDGELYVVPGGVAQINMTDDVAIMPFAQIDVMQTLIDGIAPVVKEIYFHGLSDPIKALLQDISNQVRPANANIADNDYVKTVLEDCRLYFDSKLEYLRT